MVYNTNDNFTGSGIVIFINLEALDLISCHIFLGFAYLVDANFGVVEVILLKFYLLAINMVKRVTHKKENHLTEKPFPPLFLPSTPSDTSNHTTVQIMPNKKKAI